MSSYFSRALEALKPNSEWVVTGDQYSRLTWLDESQTKPTEDEINAKIAELKAKIQAKKKKIAECIKKL